MRILVTLIAADSGGATVLGRNIATEHAAIRSLIGYMPQRFSLYQDLSVRENLVFFADVFGVPARERTERMKKLLSFSRLDGIPGPAGRAVVGRDETETRALVRAHPYADPAVSRRTHDRRRSGLAQGVLGDTLRSQAPGDHHRVFNALYGRGCACDDLLFLHKGEVIESGSPAALLERYPHVLYEVSCSGAGITVPADTPLEPCVALMYPAGGTIHVAVKDRAATPDAVLSFVRRYVPAADRAARIAPSVEDVLFMLLVNKGTA